MSLMSYFDIVYEITSSKIFDIERTDNEVYRKIKRRLESMAREWMSRAAPNVDYEDPLSRIAYMYGHVPAHANLIEHIFNNDEHLQAHFDDVHSRHERVSICVFGAGPGTEILGLAKWVVGRWQDEELTESIELDFSLFERVKEWRENWQSIHSKIDEYLKINFGKRKDWPLRLTYDTCFDDVTDITSFDNIGHVKGYDIYIFSWILSEIFEEEGLEQLGEFASKVAENASDGSVFLFVDRNSEQEDHVKDNMYNIAEQAGIEITGIQIPFRNRMDSDEIETGLNGRYKDLADKIGRSPKVKWNAFWAVGKKSAF